MAVLRYLGASGCSVDGRVPTALLESRQPSSRESSAGAGWQDCGGPGAWKADVPADAKPNSWFNPKTLWAARNDVLAKHLYDPVDRARIAWVRLARERAEKCGYDSDFVVSLGDDPVSFLLIGDPGRAMTASTPSCLHCCRRRTAWTSRSSAAT